MTTLLIFQIIILIFSVVIHEVSHGYAAYVLGDPTAKMAGRLTLNPIKHLDLFGSFIVPAILLLSGSSFVIGWAKPVPYNPNLLIKDKKYGPLKVALAGPFANFVVAIVFGLTLRFLHGFFPQSLIISFALIIFINILLGVFNLIPIPPLDGSKIVTIFLPPKQSLAFQRIGMIGIFLVFLFLFLFSNILFGIVSEMFKIITGPDVWRTLLVVLRGGI